MEPVDILYLAYNRLEFTKTTFSALVENTAWARVNKLFVFDDGSTDGTFEWLSDRVKVVPANACLMRGRLDSPVAAMGSVMKASTTAYWAKIDNDLICPPGWLEVCQGVMDRSPLLDLLGVEQFNAINDETPEYSWTPARFIGGIGLFKRAIFDRHGWPVPNIGSGRFGFTDWQTSHEDVIKGWLNPGMRFVLLDQIHVDPWESLSNEYRRKGWQR